MILFGSYNQFTWHDTVKDIRPGVIYNLEDLDFIISEEVTQASIINVATGAETSLTVVTKTYDINGETQVRSRVTGTLGSNNTYYIKLNYKFSDYVKKSTCGITISASNECSDLSYDWGTDAFALEVLLYEAVQTETMDFEEETDEIITEAGSITKTKKIKKFYGLECVLPIAFHNLLNSMKNTDEVKVDNRRVKNIKVTKEDQPGGYAKFSLRYQLYEVENKNACCDELNLDTISIIGVGGGSTDCVDYEVDIVNTSGTLVATASGVAGASIYKWYRNGLFQSTGNTLVTNGVYGEYKVEATNSGCFTTGSIFLNDPCNAMTIEAFVTLNSINANIENEIDGTTYEVRLNGVLKSTSLPYVATEAGVYYVYAINGNCKKVSGVYVTIQNSDCDFTVDIDITGNVLSIDSDVTTPYTILWEKEDATGRNSVGTGSTLNMSGTGIYFLTITKGTCSKEVYYFNSNTNNRIINVLTRQSGYQFNVYEINLSGIDPTRLKVYFNSTLYTYTSGTPGASGLWSIASGQIVTWSAAPFTNATIKIEYE